VGGAKRRRQAPDRERVPNTGCTKVLDPLLVSATCAFQARIFSEGEAKKVGE